MAACRIEGKSGWTMLVAFGSAIVAAMIGAPLNVDVDELKRILSEVEKKRTASAVLFEGLQKLEGQPFGTALSAIGYPDDKMTIGEDTIYTWTNSEPDDLTCTIKVVVQRGIIVATDFSGNAGACAVYARRIDPTFTGRY